MLQATVFNNPWIKVKLHPKQAVFLSLPCREALYGGAAGGGKTIALLAAALQFVDVPGYNALLLRRTYRELAMPEGIMDVAHDWLGGTAAKWNGQEHRYEFPSGATLTFGYLEIDKDKYRYQGPAFQYVGWDELTQFQEPAYRYLFSRLRRVEGVNIPLRIRAASNPGGIGHEWVKNRFFTENNKDRVFISAKLDDNPSLDRDAYKESLSALDAVTRKQLLDGNWEVRASGGIFDRSWFQIVDAAPAEILRICRGWDFAATAGGGDYTVGGRVCRTKEGVIYIENVIRGQWSPSNVEAVYLQTAQTDTRRVAVRFEQEPGASGKDVAHRYVRMLQGYDVRAIPASGSKLSRWRPLASQAEVGNVRLVRGPWNGAFIEEMNALTADDTHPNDDQCLASGTMVRTKSGDMPIENISAGEMVLTRKGYSRVVWSGPTSHNAKILCIETDNGLILHATPNHPIWAIGKGFVPAKDLINSEIAICQEHMKQGYPAKQLFLTELSLGDIPIQTKRPIDLTTVHTPVIFNPESNSYIKRFGKKITGLFRLGISSITRMATRLITQSIIWNAYENQSMAPGTEVLTETQEKNLTTSKRLGGLQRNGIDQMKGGLGINIMPSKSLHCGSSVCSDARLAVESITPSNVEEINIAPLPVQTKKQGREISKSSNDLACIAEKHSQQLHIVPTRVVRVSAVSGTATVYNIKVDGEPEYFANGILVHNCDAVCIAFNEVTKYPGGAVVKIGGF